MGKMSLLERIGLGRGSGAPTPELPLSLKASLHPLQESGPLLAYPDQPDVNEHRGRDLIRVMERVSIRAYVERWKHLLQGRVLDFGAGRQPYRDLIAEDTEYVPFDPGMIGNFDATDLPEPLFDAVLCNQVLQYLINPPEAVASFGSCLNSGGHLVLTYATNWPEVEQWDLHRYTKAGMEVMLVKCGFQIVDHTRRCEIRVGSFCLPLGYGVIARKQ
jgi:SAM-dependent methyltransferase